MAEDITDVYIATEAGDAGWQSLSALAAEQVEPELPISSADGSVVLDSPSVNKFTVTTKGSEKLRIDGNGRILCGEGSGDNPNFNFHFRTPDSNQFVLESDTGIPQLKLKADDFWYYFSLNPSDDNFRLASYNGTTSVSYNVFTAKSDGNFEVNTGMKTPSISGLADNDASIRIGANLLTINHTPTQPNSIATKQTVDDKIWVGTTAAYNALATKNPTTLYCLTD